MPIDKKKQRARWRRNKAAQRKTEKAAKHESTKMSKRYMSAILLERDRRAQIEQIGYLFRYSHFFEAGTWEKAISFAADVWAATVIVEAGSENAGATTRQIREQLEAHGRTHGYERNSLRAMIRKAQKRVKLLEETLDPETGRPYWPPFSVSSDG